jgi:hypothetical protein
MGGLMPMNPFHIDLNSYTAAGRVLRQSTLGTADTCHRRLQYDRDPSIPYGTGEARIVGTAYHAGWEQYYLNRRDAEFAEETVEIPDGMPLAALLAAEEAFDREVERAAGTVTWETSEEAARARVNTLLATAWPQLVWPPAYKVIGVEQEIWCPIPDVEGWVMKGTLDLILRGPDSDHILVDHKTAGKRWKAGKETFKVTNQAAWYTLFWPLVWEASTGEKVGHVRFVFDVVSEQGCERREATDATLHHNLVLLKAAGVAQLIDNDGPYLPNTSSFLCDKRWCDHWYRCEFGEAREQPVAIRS